MATNDSNKRGGCFRNILLFLLILLTGLWIIGRCEGNNSSTPENYNDNSTVHQIFAKNCLVDFYLKKNLKDAKSYEEVSYTSSYSYSKECYEVTVKYRAKNSFGALVLEKISADVYFDGENVSFKNVESE